MSSSVRVSALCAAVLLSGMLASCGEKESAKSVSQVAVKVNKGEITVHQVNNLLQRGGNIPQDRIESARSAVVERRVDQELLVQRARDAKLDRNPDVKQMIQFSEREILARAYGEQVASGAAAPTDAQVNEFYEKNPALFAKRRVYALQEINIRFAPERFEEVHAHVQAGGNMQKVTEWLNEQKIQFAVSSGTKAAEQLPFEILNSLVQSSPGQAAFIRTPTGALILHVIGVQDAPVDQTGARNSIVAYLTNQARAESLKNEIKRLREAANIQYVGEFKPSDNAAGAPAEHAAPASMDDDPVRAAIERGAKLVP